jgi:hypothetical protein
MFKPHLLEIGLAFLILLSCNWTFFTQPMFYTHDYLHGARIAEMARGLKEGQLPVIWSQNFGFGYGMPMFEFYAPAPYFVGALFYFLGLDLVLVTKLLYVLSNILTFFVMYFWAREFYSSKLAILAAGFATLASYRAMDIFARGALSEIWGIMALPWLFFGITRLIRHRGGFWSSFIGGVTLILSHNLTTLLATPFILLYVLLLLAINQLRPGVVTTRTLTKQEHWSQPLNRLVFVGLLVLGASAFYFIPALLEKNYTQLEQWILSDYFDFHNHFVYLRQFFWDRFGYGGSGWGDNDGLSFFLGWAQLLCLAGTGLVMMAGVLTKIRKRHCFISLSQKMSWGHFGWWLGLMLLLVGSLLLTTEKSLFLWERLYWLAYVQFPWRFLGLSLLFLALLAPFGLQFFSQKAQAAAVFCLGLFLLYSSANPIINDVKVLIKKDWSLSVISASAQLFTQQNNYLFNLETDMQAELEAGLRRPHFLPGANYFTGEKYLTEPSFYVADPDYIATDISRILVDYLPKAADNLWVPPAPGVVVLNQETQPEILVARMHEKLYRFSLSEPTDLEFAVANYPEWRAEINGKPTSVTTSTLGNIQITVPAGSELLVGLKLQPTPLRAKMNWLSAGTWLAIISYGFYHSWLKQR